jgi:misacylated tRNA(Ala) deacylase
VTEEIQVTDSYQRATEATLVEVRPEGVVLDRTVFYSRSGGQPGDTGWLRWDGGEARVSDTFRQGGVPVHALEGEAPTVGTRVQAEIDWDRRYLLMRTHTALHALCGVVWRDFGALVTGGNMEPGAGRMDFEFERLGGELVGEIEEKVNRELVAGRDVRVAVLPRAEAFAIPDLIRTKINLLPEGIAEVRTIEIVGLDLQADGGTHVANTGEVGTIRVTGYESKGRINKRIRIQLIDPEGPGQI